MHLLRKGLPVAVGLGLALFPLVQTGLAATSAPTYRMAKEISADNLDPVQDNQAATPAEAPPTANTEADNDGRSTTLHAAVDYTWTPQQAREASFRGLNAHIDPSRFSRRDPEFNDSFRARIMGLNRSGDKVLSYFSNGDYCYYHVGQYESYCYRGNGGLYKISVSNQPKGAHVYPMRDADYSFPEGDVVGAGLYVAPGESYVFAADGRMRAHWLNDTAYGPDGDVLMTRRWTRQSAANFVGN